MSLKHWIGASLGILLGKLADLVDRVAFGDLFDDLTIEDMEQALNQIVPLPERDEDRLWVLDDDGVRAVLAMGREEGNDDIVLLTMHANAAFHISEDDLDEPEE